MKWVATPMATARTGRDTGEQRGDDQSQQEQAGVREQVRAGEESRLRPLASR